MGLIIFMIFILPSLAVSLTVFFLVHKGSQKKIVRNVISAIILGAINTFYLLLSNNVFTKYFGHSLITNDNLKLGFYIIILSLMHIPVNWVLLKLYFQVFHYEKSSSLKASIIISIVVLLSYIPITFGAVASIGP